MRFVHLYLIGYFVLLIGAGLALWQAGILKQVSPLWTGLAALIACLLGILLALTSTASPRPVPSE